MAGEQGGAARSRARVQAKQDPRQALKEMLPWMPPAAFAPEDVGAILGCLRGDAAPHQQQRAIEFIVQLSRNGGAHYFPGEDGRRDTDYALGRAYVGEIIMTISKIKLTRGGENG